MTVETGLGKHIGGFMSRWGAIETLRDLDNDVLRLFWEDLEIIVRDVCSDLRSTVDINPVFTSVSSLVIKLVQLGEFIRAEAINLELQKAAIHLANRDVILRTCIFLGYIYYNLSEFDKAFHTFNQGLDYLEDNLTDQNRRVVFLSNISMVSAEIDDLDKATSYAQEALRLIHSLPKSAYDEVSQKIGTPGYDEQRSAAMSNLGALYQEMGAIETNSHKKDEFLRRSLRFNYRSSKGRIPLFDKIRSHANKALSVLYMGRVQEAYTSLERLNLQCRKNSKLKRIQSWIQGFLAETALSMNNPDLALHHCHQSLRLAIRTADPIRENATMSAVLKPLKAIYSEVFQGSHGGKRFLDKGMPIIQELLEFLEDKDWYTARDHSRGVAGISTRLYDVLAEFEPDKLDGDDRRTLEIASLLHDIGKLWIPWGILNRITPLWDREFDIIKQHPDRGREFLHELGFPGIGSILGRHHERPDGAGYPNGGDIGSMAGRILAVADCYEAMTTPNRLYRKPFTPHAAVQRMQSLAGRQFDATVIQALPKAVERSDLTTDNRY